MNKWLWGLVVLILLSGCSAAKNYNPNKKFSPDELREDFRIFRESLEEAHPALYWYTPKDSIDYFFNAAFAKINDSMPEHKFRNVLSYVTSQIRCGHTSILLSKPASRYAQRTVPFAFPYNVKVWNDSVMVTSNLNRNDSVIRRGYLIRAIDNKPVREILDSMYKHLSADGLNMTHKWQVLSNGGGFRSFYATLFGLRPRMKVDFTAVDGTQGTTIIPVYNPSVDSSLRARQRTEASKISRRERKRLQRESWRNFRIDTALNAGILTVNTFVSSRNLRPFFKQTFKTLKEKNIKHLVLDLRNNGGGHVPLSNMLTSYISKEPFVIADSLYAVHRWSSFERYRNHSLFNVFFLYAFTHKKPDGKYHFGLYENKRFKTTKKNHFDGAVYILTGGNTFSAASLLARTVAGQDNVVIVGEETGGSAYGNAAWLIPEVTLPYSGVRFRLPLFRLVMDKNVPRTSIIPEVLAEPTWEKLKKWTDFKLETAKDLIRSANNNQVNTSN